MSKSISIMIIIFGCFWNPSVLLSSNQSNLIIMEIEGCEN